MLLRAHRRLHLVKRTERARGVIIHMQITTFWSPQGDHNSQSAILKIILGPNWGRIGIILMIDP